jgi:hypothetical protein
MSTPNLNVGLLNPLAEGIPGIKEISRKLLQ